MVANRFQEMIKKEGMKPSFKRVLFAADMSSESLRRIPSEFLEKVGDNFRFQVILKVAWGHYWRIPLSKNSRGVFMEKQEWEKFLKDNRLGNEDLLVFTHEGNMCLSVKIFKTNAMEVLKPPAPVHHRPRKYESPASSDANIFRDVKTEPESKSSETSAPFELLRKEDHEIGTDLRRKKTPNSKFIRKTTADRVHGAPHSSASSRFPRFTMEIKKSYLNFLAIPRAFAMKHLPMESTKMTLHDPRGWQWEVTYLLRESHQTFSGGWSAFAKGNKLQIGDLCTFELIGTTEMRVSISI